MSKKFDWMPILRTGTFKDKNKQTVSIDEATLDKIVAATDLNAEPQFVIEHPSFDKIGFGTIEKLKRVGNYLFALPKKVEDKFKNAVNSGKLPGRSVTLDKKDFSLRNISFLPPDIPPAVSGLGVYTFSEAPSNSPEGGEFLMKLELSGIESHFANLSEKGDRYEFAQFEVSKYPFRTLQSLLRGIKNLFIDKYSLDDAENAIPEFALNQVGDPPAIYQKPEPAKAEANSTKTSFQSNIYNGDNKMDLSTIDLSKVDPNIRTAIEALNNENQSLNKKLSDKDVELQAATTKLTTAEREKLQTEVLQFCESDDVKLKIKPADKDKVVNFLMDQKEKGVIEFSTADDTKVQLNAFDFAKELIKSLPDAIELSEMATNATAGEQNGLADYQKTAKAIADSVNR